MDRKKNLLGNGCFFPLEGLRAQPKNWRKTKEQKKNFSKCFLISAEKVKAFLSPGFNILILDILSAIQKIHPGRSPPLESISSHFGPRVFHLSGVRISPDIEVRQFKLVSFILTRMTRGHSQCIPKSYDFGPPVRIQHFCLFGLFLSVSLRKRQRAFKSFHFRALWFFDFRNHFSLVLEKQTKHLSFMMPTENLHQQLADDQKAENKS